MYRNCKQIILTFLSFPFPSFAVSILLLCSRISPFLPNSRRGRFSPRRRIVPLRAGGQPVEPVRPTGRLPARSLQSLQLGERVGIGHYGPEAAFRNPNSIASHLIRPLLCPVEFSCDSGAYSSGVGRDYRTGVKCLPCLPNLAR